jgi:peroxin-10
LTIFLLLLPSVLTSSSALNYLRGDAHNDSRWARIRRKLAAFLESPLGQSLPEIHLVMFMFGGRFYEFARRLTGLSYVGSLYFTSANPPDLGPAPSSA